MTESYKKAGTTVCYKCLPDIFPAADTNTPSPSFLLFTLKLE